MGRSSDNSDLANIKTAKQKKKEVHEAIISADIEKINEVVASDDENVLRELHIRLDGKYSSYIPNWGQSAYGYNEQFGFNYEMVGKESLAHNLSLFKARLEGYLCDFSVGIHSSVPTNNISVNVSNSNEITLNFIFEEARLKIDEMAGLNDSDTEEIKSKIDDLENISKENIPKKKKWEKVKPILIFALDKGADVAITIIGLILQMKLGL